MSEQKLVWLDADPGHDDAMAILLAIQLPSIQLLGVSTTHGNTNSSNTAVNAARCLLAFGGEKSGIKVYPGAAKPLLLQPRYAPKIHGPDGLGGVEGLPNAGDPAVQAMIAKDTDGQIVRAVEGMALHIKESWKKGTGQKVTIIACGPLTNIALFVSLYPDLLEGIEEFVFMGGGVGLGNKSAVAEFNVLCDPHAAQIVLDAPRPVVMIPLNVTHTANVTRQIHWKLLSPQLTPDNPDASLPKASTKLRHTLSTLISFFADSYKSAFGFSDGPPLHDALTVAYVAHPELFKSRRFRVDMELTGTHSTGETVVDIWNYRKCDDTWGYNGKNCLVTESLDVNTFFDIFLECVALCDAESPLN